MNVPKYLSFRGELRISFNVGEFESYLTTVKNMEGKQNRLYLLTMSDRIHMGKSETRSSREQKSCFLETTAER